MCKHRCAVCGCRFVSRRSVVPSIDAGEASPQTERLEIRPHRGVLAVVTELQQRVVPGKRIRHTVKP